ncbi:MAG: hypothetical protein WB679_11540 [Terracidiphilus sp.]
MNSHPHNTFDSHTGSGSGEAEATLRLIAGLPAPEGLEERVKAGLHQTLHQAPRSASLLRWPLTTPHDPMRSGSTRAGWMQSPWLRGAAAAAIVFVVAGGGWEVCSRIQPAQEPKAIALPPVAAHGGFSSANAIRTPKTLNGTVLTHPLPDAVAGRKGLDSSKKPVKKAKAEAAKPAGH